MIVLRRYYRKFRCSAHLFAGLLALTGVVLSSLGVIVLPPASQTSGGVFPCQGGACGCTTAEQCWKSCCCTTLDERLRWAAENGVTPPEFVLRELAAQTTPTKPKPHACCSHSPEPQQPDLVTCTTQAPVKESLPMTVALREQVNRCRGLNAYLAIFGAVICEPIAELSRTDFEPAAWLRPIDDSLPTSFLSPPTPPPRLTV